MDKKRCLAVRLSNFWALAETDGVELSVLPLFSPSLHPSFLLLPHFWGYRHFTAPMVNRHRRGRKRAVVGVKNYLYLNIKHKQEKLIIIKKPFCYFNRRLFLISSLTFSPHFHAPLIGFYKVTHLNQVASLSLLGDVLFNLMYFFPLFFSSRLSILVWFMWLFAAVETQIHKLLVPRHWLGSFAQECCLWPPVQASRLYCGILHLNSQQKEKKKKVANTELKEPLLILFP